MDLSSSMEQILSLVNSYIPNLIGAMAVLILGWLVAHLTSKLFIATCRKFKVGEKISRLIGADETKRVAEFEVAAGQVLFFILMLFVLVGFFQSLGLSLLNEPINRLLATVFEYAPRLVAPIVLLTLAWIIASALRFLILRLSKQAKLDEKIGEQVEERDLAKDLPVSTAFAETVYWLVFLLFLPAVLDALALKGLIEPVNAMVHKFLGFLPNVFAAIVIFAIGWFVARVVKKIVVNLLSSAGANRLSDKLGLKALLGDQQLSEVAGMVVYILIIIPVLISSLNSLKLEAITQPASAMLNTFLQAIPAVFAAILVLFISYVVGRVIADLVSKFLQSVGFDNLLSKLGISIRPDANHKKPSEVMGVVALIAVLLFAGIESLNLIGFQSLAEILSQFTVFAGQVAFGLVIIGLGFYIANIVAKVVASSSAPQAKFLSGLARTAVLILGFAMGLKQMGIADEIVTITFGLVLGALAIATGIAFGLGGKDSASDLVKELLSKFK